MVEKNQFNNLLVNIHELKTNQNLNKNLKFYKLVNTILIVLKLYKVS